MKSVRLIEGLKYPKKKPSHPSNPHLITTEIMVRLQELDETLSGDGMQSGGLRLISRLSKIGRTSSRAYRLLIDMMGEQKSLSLSLDELAKSHQGPTGKGTSRQSWLQNANTDIELIQRIWPEVGNVMADIFKRRRLSTNLLSDNDVDDGF